MTSFWLQTWRIDAIALVSIIAAVGGYSMIARRHATVARAFVAGIILWLLAVISPLDALGRDYLLSAHMIQHLILAQIAPPLLLLGLPTVMIEHGLCYRTFAAVERVIRQPLIAWIIGIGTLWLWHLPAIYDLAASSDPIRSLQHLSVLVAGLIFWWPVFAPITRSRMATLPTIPYLASACLASTALGMVLTFAPNLLYHSYLGPTDTYGIRYLCSLYGLTPQVDQQFAGLLMWVPCCLLYLSTVAFVLGRWFGAPERVALAEETGVRHDSIT